MVNQNTPRYGTLTLSRGAVLDKAWPAIRDNFPGGATSQIKFYDPATSAVIATVDGAVTAKALTFLYADTDTLDTIPNGAKYELFLTTADGPYKYEYGSIIRRETEFPRVAPAFDLGPRTFIDTLARNAVGRKWLATHGGIAMHDLGGGLNAMGPDVGLLFSSAGMRYFRPMATDSWQVQFMIHDTGLVIGLGGTGKMRLHMGCDIMLNVGMSIEIESGISNKYIHTGLVTGPVSTYTTGTSPYATTDGDLWTVTYDDTTKTLSAALNTNPPQISWVDENDDLPKGPGFRYWGFSWESSLLATGPVLFSVEAQDV